MDIYAEILSTINSQMKATVLTLWFLVFLEPMAAKTNFDDDYFVYHTRIAQAEALITAGSFDQALEIYDQIDEAYSFVFLRDYQVATQLAWHLGRTSEAYEFLKLGIAGGWEMKSINKNTFLRALRETKAWTKIKDQYDSLRGVYLERMDLELRSEVRKMSLKDQKKALGALFRIGSNAQDRFGERKFAPQNEVRVRRLIEITKEKGYPGEKLVGFDPWAQGILSRHNSISRAYCKQDTLFPYLRPMLISAIGRGEMSPHNFAVIEDWFIAVESGWQTGSYGYLAELKEEDILRSNRLRTEIGLRKVETRNKLIEVQEQTQMDFYLPWWPKKNGKISIAE